MLFKTVWSPNPQVGATDPRRPWTDRPAPQRPARPHDLSRIASRSCIRRACYRIIPGHEAAEWRISSPLHPLISWAKLAYLARLMQYPRVVVAHGGVEVPVAQDQLADVRRQAVLQRLGGEDPSHVVGSEGKRAAGAGREAGRHRGVLDAPFYVVAAEWPVLRAGTALVPWPRTRAMTTARTSLSSGEITSMRSMPVFDGAICRSGISSAPGSW